VDIGPRELQNEGKWLFALVAGDLRAAAGMENREW